MAQQGHGRMARRLLQFNVGFDIGRGRKPGPDDKTIRRPQFEGEPKCSGTPRPLARRERG